MFTNQISSILQRLAAAGMPTEQQAALAEFGNCSGPLDHRAEVAIDKTPTGAPTRAIEGINNVNTNDWFSTLQVSNWNSRVEGDNVVGGLTVQINGTLYADYIIGPDGPIDTDTGIEVEVITDVRYDTATHAFQKKTRLVKAPVASTESAWTPFHSAALLDTVVRSSNYNVDVTDTFVNRHTENVYALEAGSQGTDDVFDTEECAPGSGVQVLTGAGTIADDTDVVEMDTTAGGFDGTLPAFASGVRPVHVLGTGTVGNLGNIAAAGVDTINGVPAISVADNELWLFFKGSTEWKAKKLG